MGLKKKKALFVPVKQYPDVILYAVGGSALDGGRRLTLFARFLCFFFPLLVSVRASLLWIFSDYIVVFVFVFLHRSSVVILLCRWRNKFKLA